VENHPDRYKNIWYPNRINEPMHPILFTLGDYPVYTYGVMLGLAFFQIWLFSPILAGRTGNDPRVFSMAILIGAVPFILGARLFVLWANPDRHWTLERFLDLRSGGIVAFGGFIACIAAAGFLLRLKHQNTWRLADALAPFLSTGLGLVRIGCFCSGCCFGKPTSFFTGVRFPEGSIAFQQHKALGLISEGAVRTVPLYPTQLYEALFAFSMAGFLYWLHRRREKTLREASPDSRIRLSGDGRDGRIFWILVLAYAVWRIPMETLRDDRLRGILFGVLTQSQFVALLLAALALFMMLFWIPRHPYRPPASAS
jgi:phosphatidylglycerol:prolipoprotein diacylglycerol transferase